MSGPRKKISVNPPEGEAVARYTVRVKPLDVFKRQIYTHVLPLALKSAVKLTVCWLIIKYIIKGINFLMAELLEIHNLFEKITPYVKYVFWGLYAIFFLYLVWLLVHVIAAAVSARTKAPNLAAAASPEEYGFFEGGLIYSNGKDIVRIPWKKVRFAFTFPLLGLVIYAPSVTDTLIIPSRYFCREFAALKKALRNALKIKLIVFKDFMRDKDPQYENNREKIAILSPLGEPVASLDTSLRFTDMAEINNLYCRQIAGKHFRGLFGILLLLLCSAIFFTAALVLKDKAFIPVSFALILTMVLYVIYLTISNMFKGKKLLVNRNTYKKTVRYVFYPAGFVMVYENGISHVMYEDLDVMFEDEEGLALFFSPKQCLFLPARYMHSPEGIRLSHFFKASLFNLDPRRASRRYRIEDKPLIDLSGLKKLMSKKIEFNFGKKQPPVTEETEEPRENGFGF